MRNLSAQKHVCMLHLCYMRHTCALAAVMYIQSEQATYNYKTVWEVKCFVLDKFPRATQVLPTCVCQRNNLHCTNGSLHKMHVYERHIILLKGLQYMYSLNRGHLYWHTKKYSMLIIWGRTNSPFLYSSTHTLHLAYIDVQL